MKNNQIVFPSSQVDSTLPLWIRTPDVVMDRGVETRLDGQTITRNKYRSENHKNFVNFMTKSAESEERIGFGQDILQNLLKYRDFDTYKAKIVQYNYLAVDGVVGIDNVTYDNLDTSAEESVLAAIPTGDAYELLVGVDNEQAKRRYILKADEEDLLELIDGYGFPEENGVVLINDEVILYRRRVGNKCYNLQRGAAATTILPHLRSRGEYVRTEPADHYAGSVVVNLSVLFLVSLLDTIHKTYAEDIDSSRVSPEINRSTLLQNIKDFFRSKGSKLGIKALFKILFAENDVEVFYPGDRMINPSESTWSENLIIRTVPVPFVFADPEDNYTTPENVIGSEILFKSYLDDELYARSYVDYSMTYQYEGQTQYELYLNKDQFEGDCPVNTFTYLTRKLFIAGYGAPDDERKDTLTVTVESTLGFPDKGVIFIDNEAIYYTSKTPNQFLNCKRGYIGVNATHNKGSYVYGPYYVETKITDKEGDTYVSRSWPLGLVESIEIKEPGLLHTLDDLISVNNENGKDRPGRLDPREPILCQIKNKEYISITSLSSLPNTLIGVADDDPNSVLNLNGIDSRIDLPEELDASLVYTFTENYNDDLVYQITTQPERLAFVGDTTWGPDGLFFDDDYVFVSSSGFPESSVGFFNVNGLVPDEKLIGPDMKPVHVISIIPRRHNIKLNFTEPKGTDTIGVFVDGVRAFSNISPENVKQGKIGHFKVINGGQGYRNPSVVLTPPNSTAECVVDPVFGKILEVKSTSVGDYNTNPTVRITSGEGAVFLPKFDRYGRIEQVLVINGGQYYNDPPTITAVDRTGVGKGALLQCKVINGIIVFVQVINSGIDYNASATTIVTTTEGSGAVVESVTEFYSINRYEEVIRDQYWTFDDGDGFLYEQQPGRTRSLYGYVATPSLLREKLGDDGSDHSPILGWAFDGNPIYGPYGFTNNTNEEKGVEKQVSAYKKRKSRLGVIPGGSTTIGSNPPSPGSFAMGHFVEDFVFDPYAIAGVDLPVSPLDGYLASETPELLKTTGTDYHDFLIDVETVDDETEGGELPHWILDANNGKICNTPDFPEELYPDGVYCYFLTVDENDTPVFPYIIGETFENFPLSQEFEFDYKEVERLRNPYLKSSRRDLRLEISGIQSGSISETIVQDGGSDMNMVGDYILFDDTNTGGAGAQGIISYLEGKTVVSGSAVRLETEIVSHRQLLNFSNNIDLNGVLLNFTFVKDKEIRSFSPTNYARSTVSDYDTNFWEMKCQTITLDLIQSGDGMYDHNRKYLTVGDVIPLDELESTKRLYVNDIRNFEVGDLVEIDNGSLDEEYRDNEIVKIDQIYSSGSIVVIRGMNDHNHDIPDQTTIHNVDKYVYTIETSEPHFMIVGDKVKIMGSQYDDINGSHTLISVDPTSFEFYVSQEYDEETELTYMTSSEVSTGKVGEVKMTSPGYGYESLPKVYGVTKKFVDRSITHIVYSGGEIKNVDVRFGGSRYVNPRAVFIDSANKGYGARADVVVSNGKVTEINMIAGGADYIEPTLYLVEEDATFIAITDDIGGIESIKVIDPGRNISADLSLRPELQVTTRLVVKFEEGNQFNYDDQVYQGTATNMTATASVVGFDYDRQILIVQNMVGILKSGEYIYNTNGTKAMVLVSGQSDCRVLVDDVAKPAGDFIDDKSKISEAYAVIQDSYRFQWFSYVISSPLQQTEYDTFVKEIVHPSGFIQFGDVSIHDSTQSGSIIVEESPFDQVSDLIVPLITGESDMTPIIVNLTPSDEFWINIE